MQEWDQFKSRSQAEVRKYLLGLMTYTFPVEGRYVFAKSRNDRAICLVWDENEGEADFEQIQGCYREIHRLGLKVPFLLFGRTCTLWGGRFEFIQLPLLIMGFKDEYATILHTVQGMNLQRNLQNVHMVTP